LGIGPNPQSPIPNPQFKNNPYLKQTIPINLFNKNIKIFNKN